MNRLPRLAAAVLLPVLLAAVLIWGAPRSAVDWRRLRAVCLASDDWGLPGFVPDSLAIAHLDRRALAPGGVMEVYWHSTLEDSAMVADLGAVLARHRDRDGLPAVLQPNYILASLAYDPDAGPGEPAWRELELPQAPPGYERPGMWRAVLDLQRAGLWHPELHGRWHYDPELRKRRTAASPAVQAAAARQILPFPGAESAWELGSWRDPDLVARELDRNLVRFRELFGYPPRSVIAPDYHWLDRHEDLWCARGLRVIQGQRQQRQPGWQGRSGRLRKLAHRIGTRWSRPDRVYLDRNCLFEPVQGRSGEASQQASFQEVTRAWARGSPAIVQTHRINFVHLDAALRRRGLAALDDLLRRIAGRDPAFLVDAEVADLRRRGTSWAVRGRQVVLRNYSHSRRLVVVPAEAVAAAAAAQGGDPSSARPLVQTLDAGEVRILAAGDVRRLLTNPD